MNKFLNYMPLSCSRIRCQLIVFLKKSEIICDMGIKSLDTISVKYYYRLPNKTIGC